MSRIAIPTSAETTPADIQAEGAAAYADAEIIGIVLHVALNTWTNYIDKVADTDIDFPVVAAGKAA